jgi:hypothetical protein
MAAVSEWIEGNEGNCSEAKAVEAALTNASLDVSSCHELRVIYFIKYMRYSESESSRTSGSFSWGPRTTSLTPTSYTSP